MCWDGERRLSHCLPYTSTFVPNDNSQRLFCLLPIMQCAFSAHLDVGLAKRPTLCRFIEDFANDTLVPILQLKYSFCIVCIAWSKNMEMMMIFWSVLRNWKKGYFIVWIVFRGRVSARVQERGSSWSRCMFSRSWCVLVFMFVCVFRSRNTPALVPTWIWWWVSCKTQVGTKKQKTDESAATRSHAHACT